MRPKGVIDAQQVNIPALPLCSDGVTVFRSSRVLWLSRWDVVPESQVNPAFIKGVAYRERLFGDSRGCEKDPRKASRANIVVPVP